MTPDETQSEDLRRHDAALNLSDVRQQIAKVYRLLDDLEAERAVDKLLASRWRDIFERPRSALSSFRAHLTDAEWRAWVHLPFLR